MTASSHRAEPDIGRLMTAGMPEVRPVGDRSPLHRRAKAEILDGIRRGALADRLPPEDVLAASLNVSRTTLRNALLELEHEGHVLRRHGVGNFVIDDAATVTNHLERLQPIPVAIAASGFTPSVHDVVIRHRVRSDAAAHALARPAGSRFTAVSRVYWADARPAALVVDYVPGSARLDELLVAFDGEMLPILDTLTGAPIQRVRATVSAAKTGRSIGHRLGVAPSTPVVVMCHSSLDATGRVCAYADSYLIPDLFTFVVMRLRT